jgi:Rrf2 family protein
MKFSSQEEYGLRCLIEIGKLGPEGSMTIPEISRVEGLTQPYVAKLLGILRKEGIIKSVRGQAGGYSLVDTPEKIVIGNVLAALGGRLYDPGYCDRHVSSDECSGDVACSIRRLWNDIQEAVDGVIDHITLADILQSEHDRKTIPLESLSLAGDKPWKR